MILPKGLIDSHCHLNDVSFDNDRDEIIKNLNKHQINEVWDISVNFESSLKSIDLAKKHENIKSFVGIDPEVFIPGSSLEVKDNYIIENEFTKLVELVTKHKDFVFGIGETGIDDYWIKSQPKDIQEKSLKNQEDLFRNHLELAQAFELPISLHSRGAEELCLKIVKDYSNTFGIFHSFTGSYETAKKTLDFGYGLGVNGIVTFKNANELRVVYKKILGAVSSDWSPKDFYEKGIFFETDSPYLSPEGKRGERNEPTNVRITFDMFISSLT